MRMMPCDIVLLPSKELEEKAIKQSRELSKVGAKFTLNEDGPYAHVSIYMFQLRSSDMDKAKELFERIAPEFSKFNLSAARYFEVLNYLDVEYIKAEELVRLQDRVITAFNPIRSGLRPHDQERLKTATGQAKDCLEKYGSKNVYELFRPHLTFTRLNKETPGIQEKLPDVKMFAGIFERLGFFEMGEDGTCVKEILTANLV